MSLILNAVSAIQLCAGCTIEFEPMDTLGAAEDPAGVGMIAEVLRLDDQGYLVSSDALGGVVIVYDSEGRYQRELTREGDGPGELRAFPKFAMGDGGILLQEWQSPTLHLFSKDLDFIKTFRVGAGGSMAVDPATGGWLVNYVFGSDGPGAGVALIDEGGEIVRSMQPAAESPSLTFVTGDVIRGMEDRIWIASVVGMVDVFDEDLGLLGSLELELPGMEAWNPETGPAAPPAMVTDIRLAPDGSGVWVFAFAPVIDPNERRRVQPRPAIEELFDTFIYSIRLDPNGLTLVGQDQLDTMVRPLDGDFAYDLVDTPDGNRRVRVGRLRFTKGSG